MRLLAWNSQGVGGALTANQLKEFCRLYTPHSWFFFPKRKASFAELRHLFAVGSDHSALLLDTNPPSNKGLRQFQFDSRWNNDPESKEVIQREWAGEVRGSEMYEVFHKVKNCRWELRKWSKKKNFNSRRNITEIQQKLREIGENHSNGDMGECQEARNCIRGSLRAGG